MLKHRPNIIYSIKLRQVYYSLLFLNTPAYSVIDFQSNRRGYC